MHPIGARALVTKQNHKRAGARVLSPSCQPHTNSPPNFCSLNMSIIQSYTYQVEKSRRQYSKHVKLFWEKSTNIAKFLKYLFNQYYSKAVSQSEKKLQGHMYYKRQLRALPVTCLWLVVVFSSLIFCSYLHMETLQGEDASSRHKGEESEHLSLLLEVTYVWDWYIQSDFLWCGLPLCVRAGQKALSPEKGIACLGHE